MVHDTKLGWFTRWQPRSCKCQLILSYSSNKTHKLEAVGHRCPLHLNTIKEQIMEKLEQENKQFDKQHPTTIKVQQS